MTSEIDQFLAGNQQQRSAEQDRLRKSGNKKDMLKLFASSWNSAIRESRYLNMDMNVPMNRRPQFIDRVIKPCHENKIDLEAFARFVVLQWDVLRRTHFNNSQSYPDTPKPLWLSACMDKYLEAYAMPRRDRATRRKEAEAEEATAEAVRRLEEENERLRMESIAKGAELHRVQQKSARKTRLPRRGKIRKVRPSSNIPDWE